MENRNVVEWILSRKEGQIFLSACLLLILFLGGIILSMDGRNQQQVKDAAKMIQRCNDEKQQLKKDDDERFLNYIIQENEKKQTYIDRIDSFNMVAKRISERLSKK